MYDMSKSKHQWIAGVASLGDGQDEVNSTSLEYSWCRKYQTHELFVYVFHFCF